MTDLVLNENRDGVLLVTLNRPEKKNAINNAMWAGIAEVFNAAAIDDTVTCVLLTGAGDNFSAGVDLASFGEQDVDPQALFNAAALAVAEFDKPLVAAARGAAVGGGATVLFHADMVYAGESLRMRLPFASLGLAPEWASSYMLPANIGAQRAAELFYTAQWIDAGKALDSGVVAAVLPDEDVLAHAEARAREIAQWPVNSLREIKRTLRMHHLPAIKVAMQAEQEAMARQAGSPENIEAMTAFLEKRKPDFRNL
ncbi:enoyl-CoA hydratase [Pseudohalioglobus sediminis]|uniref:Enoyl-CoA hydratase n=1 Tax=Pseudohalioglobus sediminis TaxID=2606449 RepID=A0A5B0X391_9GAMM|nr:enoyl-CoA hydratase-related protein [Pseudohalioglobus sediminis]KAA1193165.1 enoyl-CoA hydratase [Pseudohalioglobus sediminis]